MRTSVPEAKACHRDTRGWLAALACGLVMLFVLPGCGGTSKGHRAPAGLPGRAVRPVSRQPPVGTLTQVTPEPMPPKEAPRPAKSAPIPPDSLRNMELKHAPAAPVSTGAQRVMSTAGDYVYVEVLAEPIRRFPPSYPDEARNRGVDGTVHVSALVGVDGLVHDTRVVRSIPLLDSAAVMAVRQWRFVPAKSAGKPIATWVAIPVKFSLR